MMNTIKLLVKTYQCAFQAGLNVNRLTKIATCKRSFTYI